MKPDPTIDEIRRIRHEMSAEHDHDPKKMVAYYAEIKKRYADRVVGIEDLEPPSGQGMESGSQIKNSTTPSSAKPMV